MSKLEFITSVDSIYPYVKKILSFFKTLFAEIVVVCYQSFLKQIPRGWGPE